MVICLYNSYIFVWVQNDCLVKMVFALDPNNSIINVCCGYPIEVQSSIWHKI